MMQRQPVERLLEQGVDTNLERQIRLSQTVLAFANAELGLPKTKSYQSYVQLKGDFPVWNVVAAPEFSLAAQQWCYLVIGCASYRGYFNKARAQRYAQTLEQQGLETYLGGAIAYSTLGWFKDPLLSSMFRYGDHYLVETLIHELAHQQLYLDDWSELNEAFASLVAEEGLLRWLKQTAPQEISDYAAHKDAALLFDGLLVQLKTSLTELYALELPEVEKRQRKKKLIDSFRSAYEQLKQNQWNGRGWYDHWVDQPINNARLAAYSTYQSLVPDLRALLSACKGDLGRFYVVLESLNRRDLKRQNQRNLPKTCE